jgi:hypothetical protein
VTSVSCFAKCPPFLARASHGRSKRCPGRKLSACGAVNPLGPAALPPGAGREHGPPAAAAIKPSLKTPEPLSLQKSSPLAASPRTSMAASRPPPLEKNPRRRVSERYQLGRSRARWRATARSRPGARSHVARPGSLRRSGLVPRALRRRTGGAAGPGPYRALAGADATRFAKTYAETYAERTSTSPALRPPDSCAPPSLVSIPCNRMTRLGTIGVSPNIVVTIAALGDPCLQS